MITNRIASAAATFAVGLASLGATILGVAAPAAAETHAISVPGDESSARPTSTPGEGGQHGLTPGTGDQHGAEPGTGHQHGAEPGGITATGDRFRPTRHQLFPVTPHSPHAGQGRKGTNEPHATAPHIWAVPGLDQPASR